MEAAAARRRTKDKRRYGASGGRGSSNVVGSGGGGMGHGYRLAATDLGPQSGFSTPRYVSRGVCKNKSGPRTPRPPPGGPPVMGSLFLSVERGRAA
jgi:hypothetical protein